MRIVLLYQGDSNWNGVYRDSCENIGDRFKEADSSIEVIKVTAKKLINCIKEDPTKKFAWEKRIILVFPGGTASIWDAQLNDKVVLIKNFIKRGGNVFLVCAGAYFACRGSEFKVNSEITHFRCRELNLFPGKAYGPLDPKKLKVIEQKNTGSTVTVIDQLTKESVFMYFLGGGYFEPAVTAKRGRDYEISHTYEDGKIAGVTARIENGLAIMTFFHPEYDNIPVISPELIDEKKVEKMRSKIESSSLYRKKFFKDCLDQFSSYNTDFMANRLNELKNFDKKDAFV